MDHLQFLVVLWTVLSLSSANLISIPGLGVVEGTTGKTAWTNRTIHSYYSISFGKSTAGNKRYMPSEPVEPWEGVYNATTPRRACPQLFSQFAENSSEDFEDCLTMNIFTPQILNTTEADKLLPVIVFIHGGGFHEASSQFYPPDYLLEKDIVLVVPQYRLGPLGFLSLQIDEIAGNVGYMDQVLALEWVNKNILTFGGDNKRVTVFGLSSGAGAVSLLLVSPMVKDNLFQQAILHSGSAHSTWLIYDEINPRDYAKHIFSRLTNITEEETDTVMVQYLKNATIPELYAAAEKAEGDDALGTIRRNDAVIQKAGEKKFLDTPIEILLQSGKFKTVPMIAGVTKNDGSFFLPGIYDSLESTGLLNDSNYLKQNLTSDVLKYIVVPDKSSAILDTFEDRYFSELFTSEENIQFSNMSAGLIDIFGTVVLKAPTFQQAKINSQYSPTFFYTLDYQGQNTRFGNGVDTSKYPFKGGVDHFDILLYLFPNFNTTLNDADTNFAKNMVELWTNFVIQGMPTSTLTSSWAPKIKGKNGPYIHLQSTPYMDDDFIHNEYDVNTRESKLVT